MIPDEDLHAEWYGPHPQGGQHCGTICHVKVTHIPTGIFAVVGTERSQHRNRRIAVDMIEAALTSPHYR